MIVYFHIDELSRDLITASLLKKKFYYWNIIFGNRLTFKLVRLTKIYNFFDYLIIPNVDFLKEIYSSPQNINKKTKIIIMYTECTGSIINDKKRSSYHFFGSDFTSNLNRLWTKKIKYYLLWGTDSYKKCLLLNKKDKNKYKILGHPRLDEKTIKKNTINKNLIGIYTRADSINPYDKRDFINTVSKRRKENHKYFWSAKDKKINVEDTYYTMISDVRITFEIIDQLLENNFKISLRIHPRENHDAWKKFLKTKDKYTCITISDIKEPFSVWAEDKLALIGPPSTVFYESIVRDKKIYSIEEINKKRKKHINQISDDINPINKHINKPKTVKELIADIKKYKKKDYFSNNYYFNDALKKILFNDVNFPKVKNFYNNLEILLKNNKKKTKLISLLKFLFIESSLSILQLIHWIYKLNFLKNTQNSSFFYLTPKLKRFIKKLI